MKNEIAMPQFALAVQPAAWPAFDQWGCDWVTDLEMAKAVASLWGVPCHVWRCPGKGEPMRLCAV